MLALRSLRRPLGSNVPRLGLLTRWQHGNHGPHKEYFQHPSQFPIDGLPTAQPYVSQPTPNIPPSSLPSPVQTRKPSLIRQAFRASLLVVLCLLAGYSIGTGVITWEYLQPPFEAGSESDRELLEEIEDIIEHHPLVAELRYMNWTEESVRPNAAQSQHLIHNTLSGVQGLPAIKIFRQPLGGCSVLVFFTGFGVEGWPDVVHGGTLVSMFDEALEQHFKELPTLKRTSRGQIDVQFTQRVRPGEVYGLLVLPTTFRVQTDGLNSYLDFATQTVLFSGNNLPFPGDLPPPGSTEPSVVTVNLRGSNIHASAATASIMELSNFVRREDETDKAFSRRQKQAVDKFCTDYITGMRLRAEAQKTLMNMDRSNDPPTNDK